MNPTTKLIKKKKKKGGKPVVDKTETWEDVESFFSIFKSIKDDIDELDYSKQEAEFFREDLIPNSMEYYLDIMGDDDEVSDNINRSQDDMDCEDEDCEDDHEESHKKPQKKKPAAGGDKEDDKKCKNQ